MVVFVYFFYTDIDLYWLRRAAAPRKGVSPYHEAHGDIMPDWAVRLNRHAGCRQIVVTQPGDHSLCSPMCIITMLEIAGKWWSYGHMIIVWGCQVTIV